VGRGEGKLHALAHALLWIAGAKAVDFDEHDQAGVAAHCRRIVSAVRGLGGDRLGLLVGHGDRPAVIPSECDPELSTTSTIQMLPSCRQGGSPGGVNLVSVNQSFHVIEGKTSVAQVRSTVPAF
jgi:hypothetical protein